MMGERDDPHLIATPDWCEKGLPYGSFCRCHQCGYVGRATVTFDFYADRPGDPLRCEVCAIDSGVAYGTDELMHRLVKRDEN